MISAAERAHPGLDIVSLAMGFGCRAVDVDTAEELAHEFNTALTADGPTVIVVRNNPQLTLFEAAQASALLSDPLTSRSLHSAWRTTQ